MSYRIVSVLFVHKTSRFEFKPAARRRRAGQGLNGIIARAAIDYGSETGPRITQRTKNLQKEKYVNPISGTTKGESAAAAAAAVNRQVRDADVAG